jgi:hypothetical protein
MTPDASFLKAGRLKAAPNLLCLPEMTSRPRVFRANPQWLTLIILARAQRRSVPGGATP